MMNVMIDIETLGTKPGCAILSIAAVPFGVVTDRPPFYEKIAVTSCINAGLTQDKATMDWWKKQHIDIYAEAFSGKKELVAVLLELYDYLSFWPKLKVWGNGASFDVPILEAAYQKVGVAAPWQYYDSMCFRTLKALCPMISYEKPKNAHSALADATSQAHHAEKIIKFLRLTCLQS